MKNLEEIDVKILKELLKDGRKSFSAIAKQYNISDDIVRSRFQELEKSGVIVGATVQFNFKKFGYSGVATTMLSLESQYIPETLERIRKIPNIRFVGPLYGYPFNVSVNFTLKDLSNLEYIRQVLCRQNKVNSTRTYIWTDCRNIPENILEYEGQENEENDSGRFFENSLAKQEPSVNTDEVDMKLIDALAVNGRLAFSEIARQIGSSTATVARKYMQLCRQNLIKVSIQINPIKLGFQGILAINLITDPSESDRIADSITKIPKITYILKITGNYDLSAVALVRDCGDIIDINNRILEIPNISGIEASLRPITPVWPSARQYITTF